MIRAARAKIAGALGLLAILIAAAAAQDGKVPDYEAIVAAPDRPDFLRFLVFLVANMRYVSGQPVPSTGTIQVKLTPVVQLLKR